MAGKCPRCQTVISAAPDAQGVVTCPACHLKLKATAAAAPAPPVDLQPLLEELRHVKRMQGEILQLQAQILNAVRSVASAGPSRPAATPPPTPAPAPAASEEAAPEPGATPVVARVRQRRKTVLLVDDDAASRAQALTALAEAQVPTREAADGHAALEAIAAEKPDVLVLELGLAGALPGRDLINMVRSTMEWVDIRLVLYTREVIGGAEEARQQHGADELVIKGAGSAQALVNRVIQLFQQPRG